MGATTCQRAMCWATGSSKRHPPGTKYVPLNEYTAMSLAAMAGIDIPEIKLVDLDKLDNLPQINLPDEQQAFAIKRFDRSDNERIHMEDFAQILVKYPHEKYGSASYEQIGKVTYTYSGDGLADVQQLARRLLVNILLANGDAHLKNWSLLYQDQVTPRLSPAYDIVTTKVYIKDETKYALNLGKTKEWYAVTVGNFQAWADRAGIPWAGHQTTPRQRDGKSPLALAGCSERATYGRGTQDQDEKPLGSPPERFQNRYKVICPSQLAFNELSLVEIGTCIRH